MGEVLIERSNENKQGAVFIKDDQEQSLNADLSIIASVSTEQENWQASPMPGVWPKRLELMGKDSPQLTTLVKFEPTVFLKLMSMMAEKSFGLRRCFF